jgi:hypothetical protein
MVPALAGLLPDGLRRGGTVSVAGSTALVLALLAEATREGSWAAIAGMPGVGVVAATDLGVGLDRIALVPDPGVEVIGGVSALIDGFDLVVLGPAVTRGIQPSLARELVGRVRNRGVVLLATGPWPSVDLELASPNAGGMTSPRTASATWKSATLSRPAVAGAPRLDRAASRCSCQAPAVPSRPPRQPAAG